MVCAGSGTIVLALPSPLPPPTCFRDHHKQFPFSLCLDGMNDVLKINCLRCCAVCLCVLFSSLHFCQPLHFPHEEQASANENIYKSVSILISHGIHEEMNKTHTQNTNEENNYIPIAVCNFFVSFALSCVRFGFLRGISRLSNAFGRNAGTISCVLWCVYVCINLNFGFARMKPFFFYLFRRFYFGNLNWCCFYYFTVFGLSFCFIFAVCLCASLC